MLLSRINRFPIDKIARTGKLSDWSDAANGLFAPGCEAQGIALLASFASPLLSLFKGPDGGVLYSIYGARKTGKSTALCAAGSVWALPEKLNFEHCVGDDRFSFLTDLGNLPALNAGLLRRDQTKTQTYLARVFAGAYAHGGFWRGSMIAINGMSLFDVLKDARRTYYPPYGVEFKISVPKALQQPHFEYRFMSNAGQPAVPYLHYLAKEDVRMWARQHLVSHFSRLKEEYALTDPKVDHASRFQRRAIAAIHVAGLITTKLELLDFDVDRISEWAAERTFQRPQEIEPAPPPALPLPEDQATSASCPLGASEENSHPPAQPSKTPTK